MEARIRLQVFKQKLSSSQDAALAPGQLLGRQ